MRTLSQEEARRIVVRSSGLAGRVDSVVEAVHVTGDLQIDATNVVARTHLLVLWSRLGAYDVAELDRLLWHERSLFEWNSFVYPARDAAIYRTAMRLYPIGNRVRTRYIRDWLAANATFERYILAELRQRGALRSRDLEDRATVPWQSGGWNDGKNLSRMLEILAQQGKVMVAGRNKAERIWDLGERVLPPTEELETHEAARRLVLTGVRAQGLARPAAVVNRATWLGWVAPDVIAELENEALLERVRVKAVDGEWIAHPDALGETAFEARTTLLSPFDNLIRNRERTRELFDFLYRLEIYVPRAKRSHVLVRTISENGAKRNSPPSDRSLRLSGVRAAPTRVASVAKKSRAVLATERRAPDLGAQAGSLSSCPDGQLPLGITPNVVICWDCDRDLRAPRPSHRHRESA